MDRVTSIDDCLNLLKDTMQENNINCSLVLSSYKVNEHRPSAAKAVEAIKGRNNHGVLSGILFIHFKFRDIREIVESLENGLIKGLKFNPGYKPFYPNDSRLKVWYEMAIESSM